MAWSGVSCAALVAVLAAASSPVAAACKVRRAESDVAGVRLADVDSSAKVLGDASALPGFQEKDAQGVDADFPYVRLLNRNGQQEARFYTHYGTSVGQYNEIEVMPVTPAGTQARRLPVEALATERGVKLGMKEADLVRLLGPCHKSEALAGDIRRISYTIEDEGHALLRRSAMPSYYARYDFSAGRLVRFRIGFDYP